MRMILLHSLLSGLLVAAPLFADSVTITGVKDGQTVLTLTTTMHGDYPLPLVSGVKYTVRFSQEGTPPQPPGPPEPPPPGPDDPLPEGKYKIQRQVRDWANAVSHPDRVTTSIELAKNYRETLPGIVNLVGAKTPKEALDVAQLLTLSVVGSFGGAQEAWKDFGTKLAARINELIASGQVSTVAQFLEMTNEVAAGLLASSSPEERKAAVFQQLEGR